MRDDTSQLIQKARERERRTQIGLAKFNQVLWNLLENKSELCFPVIIRIVSSNHSSAKFLAASQRGAGTAVVRINQLEIDAKSEVMNKSSDTVRGGSRTASFTIQMLN